MASCDFQVSSNVELDEHKTPFPPQDIFASSIFAILQNERDEFLQLQDTRSSPSPSCSSDDDTNKENVFRAYSVPYCSCKGGGTSEEPKFSSASSSPFSFSSASFAMATSTSQVGKLDSYASMFSSSPPLGLDRDRRALQDAWRIFTSRVDIDTLRAMASLSLVTIHQLLTVCIRIFEPI